MKNLFAFLLLLCLSVTLSAQQLQPATVKAVHDGDSYKVSFTAKPDSVVWLRLYGVDAPEVRFPGVIPYDQPYGRTAADSVRQLIKGSTVLVKYRYTDVYKRPVCEIFFTAANPENGLDTLDLATHIISRGWAWQRTETKNAKGNALLKRIQADAKEQKIGLWGLKGRAVRPDTFRSRFRSKN